MSDHLRRYRAIRDALTQAYPLEPTGNLAVARWHSVAALCEAAAYRCEQLPCCGVLPLLSL